MARSLETSNISKSSNSVDIYRGQSLDLELEMTVDEEQPSGEVEEVPLKLTGVSVFLSVKKDINDTRPIIEKSTASALEIEVKGDPDDGIVLIHFDPTDTKDEEPGEKVFDVWVILASGKRYPVVEVSIFKVLKPVTVLT
jgi:hypothetical protein